MEHGFKFPMQRGFLSPALLFFADLQGQTFEADARIYRETLMRPPEITSSQLIAEPAIEDIRKLLTRGQDEEVEI